MSFSISFMARTQRNIRVTAADVNWAENSSYRMHWLLTANGSDISEGWVGYSESSVYLFDFGKSYYEPGQYQVTARLYEGTSFIELQRESFEFPCTVTIYANDGSGDSQEETVSYGATYTIPECPFSVPSGKIFAGYAGTATATTAQWQPGQTTTVNVDRDFYCIWADIPVETYTITYDANGGYGAPPQQTVDGVYIIISDTIPTRNGYTFAGWMGVGATSGQEVWRQPGQALGNITEDYTFTAEWYVYAITAIAGDYVSSVSREWHGLPYIDYLGNTYTSSRLTCQLASPTGYTVSFDGWYDSNDSKVSSNQTYTVSNLTSDITLTAKATAVALPTYTVTYRPGTDGTGSVQTDTKIENVTLTLKGAVFTRSGYEQNGWATSDGGTKAYELGAQYTANAAITLYPTWKSTAVEIGSLDTGSIVKLNVNGSPVEFIVVNQGIPENSSLYDASCNGTWLLMKDIYENRAWNGTDVNNYAASDLNTYLNNTFFASLGSKEKNAAMQVKLPYGDGTSVISGANGVAAKTFLISAIELGQSAAATEYKANFADNTWAEIIEACQTNSVPDTWVVGDQKTMSIGESYKINIIGKNHDTYSDGSGTAPLTLQMHEVYNLSTKMSNDASNAGGWKDSIVRTTTMNTLLNGMPDEVKAAVREVSKLTSAGQGSETIVTTADKLFIPSEVEITGSAEHSAPGEGTQYPYYETLANRMKYTRNDVNVEWWTRSPVSQQVWNYVGFYQSGNAYGAQANKALRVAAAFCF